MPLATELLILDCNRVNGVSCNPDIVGASGDVWIKVVPVFAHFARCKTEFPRALNTTSVLPVMVGSSGQSPRARSKEKVRPILITYISSGSRIAKRARLGNAQATLRCGEPVQLQLWVRIFCLQSRRRARRRAGPWAFCKLRDDGIVPLICPTCQNVFAGFAQSIHASDHHATLHGVVFDILVGSESRVGPCG